MSMSATTSPLPAVSLYPLCVNIVLFCVKPVPELNKPRRLIQHPARYWQVPFVCCRNQVAFHRNRLAIILRASLDSKNARSAAFIATRIFAMDASNFRWEVFQCFPALYAAAFAKLAASNQCGYSDFFTCSSLTLVAFNRPVTISAA